jgi:release factor glutamine methyltransferase
MCSEPQGSGYLRRVASYTCPMTIRDALLQGAQILEQAQIPSPRLTAEVLLMHALRCEPPSGEAPAGRAWLFAHAADQLREIWWIHYGRYLHERIQGKPTQYITGHQEFFGREFGVTPDVLIPRPETEHLVEEALKRARGARVILDIGTGSGAIAATLALETQARVIATDISLPALRVAASNAKRLGARVDFVACDLGAAIADRVCDVIACNPPYVPASDAANLQREVRDYEPALALYGGQDGLAVYRRLVPEAARLLRPGGWLLMELGYAELEPVRAMLGRWREVETVADLAGIPRVIAARMP